MIQEKLCVLHDLWKRILSKVWKTVELSDRLVIYIYIFSSSFYKIYGKEYCQRSGRQLNSPIRWLYIYIYILLLTFCPFLLYTKLSNAFSSSYLCWWWEDQDPYKSQVVSRVHKDDPLEFTRLNPWSTKTNVNSILSSPFHSSSQSLNMFTNVNPWCSQYLVHK